jgi:hypothetical protein
MYACVCVCVCGVCVLGTNLFIYIKRGDIVWGRLTSHKVEGHDQWLKSGNQDKVHSSQHQKLKSRRLRAKLLVAHS